VIGETVVVVGETVVVVGETVVVVGETVQDQSYCLRFAFRCE